MESHKGEQRRRKRVLIIDDEPEITFLFKMSLESEGFEVDIYNDPVEALPNF